MELKVVNSSSAGNAYALDSGSEILLLEAGCKMADVKRAIDFRLADVVGCCVTHRHFDHSRCATEYAKFGVHVYGCKDIEDNKQFPYGKFTAITPSKTLHLGSFDVAAFPLNHDVPSLGYIIRHPDMGVLIFITDTFKMGFFINDIDHWLIEANYDDRILKANVEDGKIDRVQANRLMLSHMSLDNTINYLRTCGAEKSKTITLCHLSERNSDPKMFRDKVAGEFGVPTYIAAKNVVVELNKKEI
jgi:phosphoribosyl 1,2-cyclic phosphodiesterase